MITTNDGLRAVCDAASAVSDFFPVQSLEQQLQHEADSDELRSQAEDAASDLREQHHWQNARKPKMHHYQ